MRHWACSRVWPPGSGGSTSRTTCTPAPIRSSRTQRHRRLRALPARSALEVIAKGAYLARAGNCVGCHTDRGDVDYAGGRGIETPFGVVYASNLTPDDETGIGRWSAADFWRALHHGRSRDGRLLYPAFPYPSFTAMRRDDADALFAYLRSLAPARRPNRPHALRFPYDQQASLAVWRALYFRPQTFGDDPGRSPEWNRGGYLVRTLGHCDACHAARNLLGATTSGLELGGGLIPMQNWYAPSLAATSEAGVADWPEDEIVALLQSGVSSRGTVMGPMAEVVFRSTQYLSAGDLHAIAAFLRALPADRAATPVDAPRADDRLFAQGQAIYGDRCATCHGADGHGVPGRIPPLAGNSALTTREPNNVVKAILNGGFAPATALNPRPFGMPPFGQVLRDDEVAAVATYVRQSWGRRASAVRPLDVLHAR